MITLSTNKNNSLNTVIRSTNFMGLSPKLNLKSVSESLCADYFEKQVSPFDNPLFYKYLSKSPKQLDAVLKKVYRRKLPQLDKVLEENNIDKKHRVLLTDPEVSAHIDELGQYVMEKNIDTKKLTPFELRQQFSDYLGTETVYRGLNISDNAEIIDTLKKEGLYPKIAKDKNNILKSIKYYLSAAGEPVLNIFSRLGDVVGGRKNTEFMSVSSIYDVSASVAKNGSNNPSTPVVVVKSEVPKLSVIKQKGLFTPRRRSADMDVLIVGDKRYDYETQGDKIEAFIPFHIPNKNSEFKIDTTTPDYRWG